MLRLCFVVSCKVSSGTRKKLIIGLALPLSQKIRRPSSSEYPEPLILPNNAQTCQGSPRNYHFYRGLASEIFAPRGEGGGVYPLAEKSVSKPTGFSIPKILDTATHFHPQKHPQVLLHARNTSNCFCASSASCRCAKPYNYDKPQCHKTIVIYSSFHLYCKLTCTSHHTPHRHKLIS